MTVDEIHTIKSKLILGLKLTPRQRAGYLLFIATPDEVAEFLKKEGEC